MAWQVRTARDNEPLVAAPLMDATRARGFAVETCAMDKGYDVTPVHEARQQGAAGATYRGRAAFKREFGRLKK